jgi:hypothetical protein
MRARFLIYLLLPVFFSGLVLAQVPADQMLPDAPSKAPGFVRVRSQKVRGRAIETEKRQFRPSFPTNLTAREKYGLAYRRIVSPQMPLKAVFASGFELAAGTGPDLPTNGWVPFGERVGYNVLNISTTTFFNTAFVPALAHQDPRFFPLGEGPVKSRVLWAVRSEFVGFSDDGHTMPNYANLIGFALSSMAANLYYPHSSLSFGDTVQSYSIKIGVSTGMNVGREFGVFNRLKAFALHSKTAER